MKLQFPAYLIGGPISDRMAWLKSKLDDKECLFVFTSAELAQQFIETQIKNSEGLAVVEIAEHELRPVLRQVDRCIAWIVVDFRSPTEYQLSVESVLADLPCG